MTEIKKDDKIYLAARYSRHQEMQGVRDVLEAFGLKITSRWIDAHGGKYPASFTPEQLNTDPEYCAKICSHDLKDILCADVVISFTEKDNGGKGGRHVEFGIALGTGKKLIIVGPRENIFHTLDGVTQVENWPALVRSLSYLYL